MDDKAPRYGGSQQSNVQCVVYKIEIIVMGLQTRNRDERRG
jgi:hypothetical protein